MFCKYCGSKVDDGANFCQSCGAKSDDVIIDDVKTENAENVNYPYNDSITPDRSIPSTSVTARPDSTSDDAPSSPHVPKCFYIFQKVGFGLGLGSFIASFFAWMFPFGIITIIVSIIGLVLSILGKRAGRSKGIVFSALGLGISIVLFYYGLYSVISGTVYSQQTVYAKIINL